MHDPCISSKEEEAHHTHCLLQEDDMSECYEESCSETESEVSTAPTESTTECTAPTECSMDTVPTESTTDTAPTECTMEPEDG